MNLACPLRIKSPADLIAVVPYLLGFHPADSIVVIGIRGGRITFGARHDLPPPGHLDAAQLSKIIADQDIDTAVVIGYGPADRVTPAALELETRLLHSPVRVREVLRVTGDHWWSYSRADDSPLSEGTLCRPSDGMIAAEATYRGKVALPNRRTLVAQIAPVTGADRAALTEATARARARFSTLAAEDERTGRNGRWLRRAGRETVREAETRARADRPLRPDDLAWLTVLLAVTAVADYAIDRTTDHPWRIRLWTEVVRGAETDLVAMPACLLALAAWRDGQGALARVAIDRGLRADPMHELAGTLDRLLACGISSEAVPWPTFTVKPSPAASGPEVLPEEFLVPDYLPADLLPSDVWNLGRLRDGALPLAGLSDDALPVADLCAGGPPCEASPGEGPSGEESSGEELPGKEPFSAESAGEESSGEASAGEELPGEEPPGDVLLDDGLPDLLLSAEVGDRVGIGERLSGLAPPPANRAERRALVKRSANGSQERPSQVRAPGRARRGTRHRA